VLLISVSGYGWYLVLTQLSTETETSMKTK